MLIVVVAHVCPGLPRHVPRTHTRTTPQLALEKRRTADLESKVEASRAQLLVVVRDHSVTCWLSTPSTQQQQVEQEEELITNTLLKRLEQLRREKQDLSTEVERQESYLLNTLQKRLDELAVDKTALEHRLTTLGNEKKELRDRLARSHAERAELENALEAEEEKIVNTLQRQIEALTTNLKIAESKLESMGVHVRDLGMMVRACMIDASCTVLTMRTAAGPYDRLGVWTLPVTHAVRALVHARRQRSEQAELHHESRGAASAHELGVCGTKGVQASLSKGGGHDALTCSYAASNTTSVYEGSCARKLVGTCKCSVVVAPPA